MRRSILAALALFAILAAACGQKAGVAGTFSGGSGSASGLSEDGTFTDDGTAGTGGGGDTGSGGTAGTTRRTTGGGASGGGGSDGGGGGGGGAGGAEDRTGITQDEIRIGIHAPITGAAAVETFTQGAGVYAHWADKLPGVGNRRMRIIHRDDEFEPDKARLACRELVEKEKVFILVGGAGADQIQSCATYADEVGIPYLSPGVTEGSFLNLPGYFALSETYNQQNVQLAQLIKNQLGNAPVGVVMTDSPLLEETFASIRSQGLNIVFEGTLAKDGGGQTGAMAENLENAGAEIVYALISPLVFIQLVGNGAQQGYTPTYVGPGLSNGLNLVAKGVCSQSPTADVRYLSPMVQMDVINQHDPDYIPAYSQKPGNTPKDQPDDIGILLWGIEKTIRLMLDATGPDPTRQKFIQTLTSGKEFATNVYAPVKYGATPHFGASQTTLLRLNCTRTEFDTVAAFASGF